MIPALALAALLASAAPPPPDAPAPAAASPTAQPDAPAGPLFPHPVERRTLANGLTLLLVKQDTPHVAALFTVFRVGSRDEVEPGRSGLASLLEHLAYRGTKARSGEAWERTVKAQGLDSNAFTDDDVTVFWLSGPSSALPLAIELEADRFANLAFTEDDFRIEARAVLGAYLKASSSPDFKLEELVRDRAFTQHPYRHDPMGLERDLRQMPASFAAVGEFYRRFYRPENAIVIAVGDLDARAVTAAVERHFGAWSPPPASPPPPVPEEPPQTEPREARRTWPAPILPRQFIGWRTPGASDLDATAVQLVLWPYLFGPVSPLRLRLVEKGLAQELGWDFQVRRDPYLFGVALVLGGAAAEAPARAAVEDAVAAVARGEVDGALLADVRAAELAHVIMRTDTPYRTGVWLAYTAGLTGDPGALEAVLRRAAAVTPADLTAFAKRWLVPANRVRAVIGSGAADPDAGRGSDR